MIQAPVLMINNSGYDLSTGSKYFFVVLDQSTWPKCFCLTPEVGLAELLPALGHAGCLEEDWQSINGSKEDSTKLQKEKMLGWTNMMIVQWAWASDGFSPGRLSQCQSGEPPRSSCCGSPEVWLIACLSFTLWKAIPGMSGLFQRLSPSCQGPYWGPPEPVSRSPGSYLPSPARPDFRLLSNGIIFAHPKSWFMTTCSIQFCQDRKGDAGCECATFICCMYFLMLSFSFTKFLSTRSFTYTMYVWY